MIAPDHESMESIAERRRSLLEELRAIPNGLPWCLRHSDLADDVVRHLFGEATEQYQEAKNLALIATGGYGRRELAPYSDIDITILPADEASPQLDEAIRQIFHGLDSAFSALGMTVGYAYRLLSDVPGLDVKTRTGLLDMRLIAGSHSLFQDLDQGLTDTFPAGEFVLSKIQERNSMFAKHHDSPFVVEPHLKEGAGGLRCFQCANWIRESIGEQAARPTRQYDHLLRVRNLLHLLAGRQQDRLSRQRQAEIADLTGTDMYAMMAGVTDAMESVHAEYRTTVERLKETRFALAPGVMAMGGSVRVLGEADAGEAAVGISLATQLGIHVDELPIATTKEVRGPAALFAISKGEPTLRNLDRCHLLATLLPELDACRTLMPRDAVHEFTVFEHTLRVVRFLDQIEPDSWLGEVKAGIKDLEPLYLAALLHDVGKIEPLRNHSLLGAKLATQATDRWQLAPNIADDVVWLVREHLAMTKVIRLRDIEDAATVRAFAKQVGDPNRLAMLTLLTWADVNAVAHGAWTSALETFHRLLYRKTLARLEGQSPPQPDVTQTRQRLLRQLRGQVSDEAALDRFVQSLPAQYLTSTPSEVIRLHVELAREAELGNPAVEVFNRPDLGGTEFTICALDKPALLRDLLGVFYALDLSVGGIRASTTDTEPAIALDAFVASFGNRPVPPATINQCTRELLSVLRGEGTADDLLRARGKDPDRIQEIEQFSFHEGSPGILEVRAPRGRGLPYRLSWWISQQGWNIVAARVGQWGGNAAATFYIDGVHGQPLGSSEVESTMQSLVLADAVHV